MSETSVAERLKTFIESKGLSYSQFADTCGIPRPSLSQLLTGRNKKINDIMVGQIHNMFPELSVVWLLFGEGSMNISSASEIDNSDEVLRESVLDHENGINSDSKKIIFTDNGKNNIDFRRENGLNSPENTVQLSDLKAEKLQKKIKELEGQIDIFKKNPRKAVQIMVYYDDSTFEIFIPQ